MYLPLWVSWCFPVVQLLLWVLCSVELTSLLYYVILRLSRASHSLYFSTTMLISVPLVFLGFLLGVSCSGSDAGKTKTPLLWFPVLSLYSSISDKKFSRDGAQLLPDPTLNPNRVTEWDSSPLLSQTKPFILLNISIACGTHKYVMYMFLKSYKQIFKMNTKVNYLPFKFIFKKTKSLLISKWPTKHVWATNLWLRQERGNFKEI